MRWALIGLGCAGLIVLSGLLTFVALSHYPWNGTLGEMGDFVGGFGNPLLTFFTFIGVLFTISLQIRSFDIAQKEARDAEARYLAQAMEASTLRFEQTFFQMLALHNSLVSQLDLLSGGEVVAQGRDCFKRYYKNLCNSHDKVLHEKHGVADVQCLSEAYSSYWAQFRQDLGHYFRFLYNLMRFIDEAKGVDQEKYARIVRAQLSDYELVALFYNCLTDKGQSFTKYAVKFSLLDNMPPDLFIEPFHKDLIDAKAFRSPPSNSRR